MARKRSPLVSQFLENVSRKALRDSRAQGTTHSVSSCECPQLAYSSPLKATLVELPVFERFRASHLSDADFAALPLAFIEAELMARRLDG